LRDVRALLLGAFVLGLAVSITLAETALALLALRWAWRLWTGRARRGWPLAVPFAAWIAASLLAAALSPQPLASLLAARSVLLIATFYVLLDALVDPADADRWLSWLLALMAGVAVIGVLQVALCPFLAPLGPVLGRVAAKCHRAHAFYSIYMTLAGVLSLVLLAVLPRVLPGGGSVGVRWHLVAWLAGGAGLALTYVRGAWVGLLAGVAVLLGLLQRGRLLLIAGVVLLALAVLLVPDLRRRVESIADPMDPTARERWAMWGSALAMARDHPLLGVGPGGVKREYPQYAALEFRAKRRGHVHNTPLQVLVERGILGLAAWTSVFLAFFWRAARVLRRLPGQAGRPRDLVTGSMAAIAGFLVGGLTEYNFGDSEVALVAYAMMALPFVVERAVGEGGGTVPLSRH
jgi:putative inorganic carbon (HCO3(-)) transporter